MGKRSRFQKLPEYFEVEIGNRVFKYDDDFEAALEELKIADEPIILGDDGKAYSNIPGDKHNEATAYIAQKFDHHFF